MNHFNEIIWAWLQLRQSSKTNISSRLGHSVIIFIRKYAWTGKKIERILLQNKPMQNWSYNSIWSTLYKKTGSILAISRNSPAINSFLQYRIM